MKTIACLGSGAGKMGDTLYDAMERVGRLLALRGCRVITGGFSGVGMEAPAWGARERGGQVVGYTMMGKPGNPYLTEVVDCRRQYINPSAGPLHMEPPPEIQYGIRLGNLLTADGFIVAANGGAGTMVELMAIINLNAKVWKDVQKRVAILNLNMEIGENWDEAMLYHLQDWGVLPDQVLNLICAARTPEEAVDWALCR